MQRTSHGPDEGSPLISVFDGREEADLKAGEASDSAPSVEQPLVLDARGELLFFRTAAHLKAYVEAIDVTNGEYGSCWDSAGRLFELVVERQKSSVLGVLPVEQESVRVQPAEGQPTHLGDLHLALLRHLDAVNLGAEMPTTNDTADLLRFAIEHAGWS
jgi:hypothetical protein